jgi:hypothetical protein
MRTDTHEKVLEKLATSDKVTIVIERLTDGEMQVTSGSWDGEKVILRDQRLWEMLPIRFRDRANIRPPAPLILAAWHDTSPMLKMLRLKEHIEWAAQHDALVAVANFYETCERKIGFILENESAEFR